ncbi:MAG TPA: orotate phosphoribosyltransferase [Xanthobacteraceae bacterium]|nr:orotate phosphoribosyltransferase [Xanthobacteraceae bacterium]
MQPLRRDAGPSHSTSSRADIRARLKDLIRARSFGRGKVKLASGRESDFYFDMKPTMLHPAGAAWLAELTLDAIEGLEVDAVGGLEMGAVPLAATAAAFSHLRGRPLTAFFVRKRPKEHGAQKLVEGLPKGESLAGRRVVIVEDVATTGGSAIQAVKAVRDEGAEIALVLTMVDRQEGAAETFATEGIPFRALFTADEFLRDA